MLDQRLLSVALKLKEAVVKGDDEANANGVLYSGQPVKLKTKYWIEIISSELREIHAEYYSPKDLAVILQFVETEKAKLKESFSKNAFQGVYDNLETGVGDLVASLKDQNSPKRGHMDDLKQKSDEELRDIMRASINNAYAPFSIYHKAKQELEFRAGQRGGINMTNSNLAIGSQHAVQGANSSTQKPSKPEAVSQLFWWIMGIVGTVVAALILAYVFGIGKQG